MDDLFIQAWATILGARLLFALRDDKAMANMKIGEANNYIAEARKADGNEGLTVNNVTPDWIRTRGTNFSNDMWGGMWGYEWGNMFALYT